MILLKDKIYVATLLILMVLLSFTYLMYMSVTMLLMFNEVSSNEEIHITIVQYTAPEVKEVTVEPVPEPKVVPVEPKPEPVVPKQEPKPVVAEKPRKGPEDNEDAYLLAQIINAEAKGEPYNGKVAVGNVVMNRVNHPDFPDTVKGVIFQKGQFYPVTNGTIYNKPSEDALKAANEVINGKQIVGKQALYFYNPKTSTSDWIFTRTTITDIGNHRFAY